MPPDVQPHPAIAGRHAIVFDGHCVLCSGFARFVHRHDDPPQFRFIIAQSALGEALYVHYGLRRGADDYESNLVFVDGRLYVKLDSVCSVMRQIGWPWRALAGFAMLPVPLKTWLYDRIARNRYRLFGRTDACLVPDASLKARLLD